jgi:hypothetical protein
MFIQKRYKIRSYEYGLLFREGEFERLLEPGEHRLFDPRGKVRVEVVSQRDPWLVHEQLDMIVKSGVLEGRAVVLDLKDHERGLVWIENRFSHVLPAIEDGSFCTRFPDSPGRSRSRGWRRVSAPRARAARSAPVC